MLDLKKIDEILEKYWCKGRKEMPEIIIEINGMDAQELIREGEYENQGDNI